VNGDLTVTGTIYGNVVEPADIAEFFLVEGDCEPGDVLVVDPDNDKRLIRGRKAYSIVAGILSENPGFLMGKGDDKNYKPLALAGQVKCKATTENGPIKSGDLLVSSSKPGYAMRADLDKIKVSYQVVGIALEELREGEGKIALLIK
jgi:hypothetical protein